MAMFVPWKLEAQPFVTRRCMGWRWRWRGSIWIQFKIHALQLLLLFHGLLRTATDCRRDGGIFSLSLSFLSFIIISRYPSDTRLPMPCELRLGKRSVARCLTRSSHSVPSVTPPADTDGYL
ncbi:hypothetical protein CI102_12350 [Trichoderma harzianum]|nr:hypothetical protein CI102_12350 [Trichoderma harzianum]